MDMPTIINIYNYKKEILRCTALHIIHFRVCIDMPTTRFYFFYNYRKEMLRCTALHNSIQGRKVLSRF